MNIMRQALVVLALSGLLVSAASRTDAAGQGRGDHDRSTSHWSSTEPAGKRHARTCRTDDGWFVCSKARNKWQEGDCRTLDGRHCGSRRILPRDLIIDWLTDWDFRRVRHLTLRDSAYTASAVDPFGQRVRLTIDAATGRILRSEPR